MKNKAFLFVSILAVIVLSLSNLTQSVGLNRVAKSNFDVQGCVDFYEHHSEQGHLGCFPAGANYL